MNYLKCSAVISYDKRYRYLLERIWDYEKPRILWAMLNPSHADGKVDDHTIGTCVTMSKLWKFGGLGVVNMYAVRTPYPNDLLHLRSPIGINNRRYIKQAVLWTDVIVAAWGANVLAKRREAEFIKQLSFSGKQIFCLGINQDGSPKHPARLAHNTELRGYS